MLAATVMLGLASMGSRAWAAGRVQPGAQGHGRGWLACPVQPGVWGRGRGWLAGPVQPGVQGHGSGWLAGPVQAGYQCSCPLSPSSSISSCPQLFLGVSRPRTPSSPGQGDMPSMLETVLQIKFCGVDLRTCPSVSKTFTWF